MFGTITYDSVAQTVELNKHLVNYSDKILDVLSSENNFFSETDIDVFKLIVPDLLSCSNVNLVVQLIEREKPGMFSICYNKQIVRYLIEIVYADREIGSTFNHILRNCNLDIDDINFYLERGIIFTIADYCKINTCQKDVFGYDIKELRDGIGEFCLRKSLELSTGKDDVGFIIGDYNYRDIKKGDMKQLVNILEEYGVKIDNHLEDFASIFAMNYCAIEILDYLLENYVSDHKHFLQMILNNEDICYEMRFANFMQILIRVRKYTDIQSIIAEKEDFDLSC
jgi:hypothetical protein